CFSFSSRRRHRRFSRDWSSDVVLFRSAWQHGEGLDFRGEFYRHTLMTPTFNPGPNPYGPPPIQLGALGPQLTRAAAEVADGLLVMPFGTTRYLRERTMAAVDAGLAAAGRRREDFAVVPEIIVSPGDDHTATRRLLALYGSTPAYRPVLDLHGWGDLQPELNALSKQGRWQEMGALIDDDILHTVAACGGPAEIAAHIRERVAGIADRVCLYAAGPIPADHSAARADRAVQAGPRSGGGRPDRRRRPAHRRRLRRPRRDRRPHPRARRGHLRPCLPLRGRADSGRALGRDRPRAGRLTPIVGGR